MVHIARWLELPDPVAARGEIERIFFAASGTQTFASDEVRAAFRERWLGRYFDHDPALVYVAVAPDGAITGYLVGSFDDPALAPRFSDIGYFARFAELNARYPAQLHVNLDERARGAGTGGLLVEAFVDEVRRVGLPGVHVVTGQGVRNVTFYERLGFIERGHLTTNGKTVVFLGRDVSAARG